MSDNFYHITDDLLVLYLVGEASLEEVQKVNIWLAAEEEHRKYFHHFKLIWEASQGLSAISPHNEHAAWKRFQQRIGKSSGEKSRITGVSWMRVAALFIVIAGAAILAYTLFLKGSPVNKVTLTAQNNVVADTLADGSVVTLNKNSSLTYPEKFKGSNRTVELKGEAFFKVAPDKKKPFIIHVNDVTVRVVGTSFNISSGGGNTEVIVETGIVQVTRKNKVVELKPGEKLTVQMQDTTLVKQKQTDKLYDYYRTREFECDNTPLWKLVDVLNKAYNAQIIIGRKELRNLPLNTTFNNESLDHILEIISITFNISVTETGDKIILQ